MMKVFRTKAISWSDIGKYQDDDSIFRGHRCAIWPLETSLERTCMRLYSSLEDAPTMEKTLLREFRRRLHHYSVNVPSSQEPLRWLSLMQHHGAPTRLLDWTYSIYIASYFALEHSMHDCAIWKINKEWLKDAGEMLFQKASRGVSIFRDKGNEEVEKHFRNDVMERNPIAAVLLQTSPKSNNQVYTSKVS
jgi:hypothetical protein